MSRGEISRGRSSRIARALFALVAIAAGIPAGASVLSDSVSVSGDSISRGFDADTGSCNYGDNVSRNWATGDNHGASFCSPGSDGTFSQAERLECAKGSNVTIFNDAASGAEMVDDFFNQANAIRANLSGAPGPRLVSVLLGHNDACTSTLSKTGNGCGGDHDPNNYCRTTNAAFEREFRRGLDQLIQIPAARIVVLATIRVSQLCNFQSKNGCGLTLGLDCEVIWELAGFIEDVFGSAGICASLTADCSNQRRIDMYQTLVGYNEILERVTNEYAAIPPGGTSASGAVKAAGVVMGFREGTFHYKLQNADLSCCDCFHPSDQGQGRLAEFAWNGLQCSPTSPCCGDSPDPLARARCDVVDTTSYYPGGFWAGGVVCGNGIVDPGEECDDGNIFVGDCCSPTCQLDAEGTFCVDDGNECTQDVCDGAGQCSHPAANGIFCDDGVFCNGDDACSGGACLLHSGDPCPGGPDCADACDEAADTCFEPIGTPCDDDGNLCTNDLCDGAGTCSHPPNSAPCDDGLFCNGADSCAGGACAAHAGDPCAAGADCADTCDEAADGCLDPIGTGCVDDGNVCTDDLCDGLGACTHPSNTAPCDDGDACTTGDACAGGVCTGGPPPVCGPCQFCSPQTGCGGPTCTPTPTATPTPTSTPVPISTPTPTPTATPNPFLCPDSPRSGCRTARKSLLLIKNKEDSRRDRLLWKFLRGESTSASEFGDPIAATDYALCVYDAVGRILRIDVPPSLLWRSLSDRGYKYKNFSYTQAGVGRILLKGSDRDRTKVFVKGKGENLPDVILGSVPAPITVQLTNADTPSCWEAVYAVEDIRRNDAEQLRASAVAP